MSKKPQDNKEISALYESIVESVNEFIFILNLDGRLIYANKSSLSILGYKEEDLIGKPFSVLLDSEVGKELTVQYKEKVKSKFVIKNFEIEVKGKGKRRIILEVSGKRMYEKGKLVGIMAIGRDISDRKQGEHELEERLKAQTFINATGNMILVGGDWKNSIDSCIERIYSSPNIKASAFLLMDEKLGRLSIISSKGWNEKKISSFELPLTESGKVGIHPEQSYTLHFDSSKNKMVPAWFADFPENISYAFFVPISPDEKIFGAFLVHAANKDDLSEDNIQFVEQLASMMRLAIIKDQSETASKSPPSLMDLNPDIIMKVSMGGRLLYANQSVYDELRTQGFGKGDWREILPEIHDSKMKSCITEKRNLKAEANVGIKTIEYWYAPVPDEEAVLLIGRDVADKDEALGELIMSEAELISSHKEIDTLHGKERTMKEQMAYAERLASLGQMGAKIAHELNNPLQIISARAELISDLSEKEKIKELAKDLQEEIQHIIEIAASYMKLGKQSQAEMGSLNLNKILTELLKALGTLGHVKYLDLKTNFDEPIPMVYGDREKIIQVFRNLIINAAHSMEETESKTLTVTSKYNDETSSIVIVVSDTGIGIKKKDIQNIFDSYFTTKGEGVGTGIGLLIVRDVVEMEMGGTIQVESTYGKGTTFIISLPRSNPPTAKELLLLFLFPPKSDFYSNF